MCLVCASPYLQRATPKMSMVLALNKVCVWFRFMHEPASVISCADFAYRFSVQCAINYINDVSHVFVVWVNHVDIFARPTEREHAAMVEILRAVCGAYVSFSLFFSLEFRSPL